jgi:hypothetical protein
MPFVDTSRLRVIERLPGWHGRYVALSGLWRPLLGTVDMRLVTNLEPLTLG